MPTATMQTKIENCEVHGIPCVRYFVETSQGQGHWNSKCELCDKQRELQATAERMVADTPEETARIVREEVERFDAEADADLRINEYIEKARLDAEQARLDAMAPECRHDWINYARQERRNDIEPIVKADRVTEFMDQLRKEGK